MQDGYWLYVMGVPSGHFKIGIAKDVEKRRQELQTGNHERIEVMAAQHPSLWFDGSHAKDGEIARKAESDLHQLLAPWCSQGEWFKVTLEQIQTAMGIVVSRLALMTGRKQAGRNEFEAGLLANMG